MGFSSFISKERSSFNQPASQLLITYHLALCVCEVVIETDKQSYFLSLMSVRDLEAVVSHVTASLKKIFPDSSPG